VITKNQSASVKTLHSLLRFNVLCLEGGIHNSIVFVDDNHISRSNVIKYCIENTERIIWFDYSVSTQQDSIFKTCIEPFENGCHGMVFPAVKKKINWDLFKSKVNSKTVQNEPISQYGMEFDTTVHKKIKNDIYSIKNTEAVLWTIDTKPLLKIFKSKKGEWHKIPGTPSEFFKHVIDEGIRLYAYTDSDVTLTYTHECIGNILNAAGIKAN